MSLRLSQVPGILLNSRDNSGSTAVMYAVDFNRPQYTGQCVEKLRALTGVDWNAVEEDGYSAIMMAVYHGFVDVVEALLPVSTLDLNITASDGFSVAHIAVESHHVDSIRILKLLSEDGRVDW